MYSSKLDVSLPVKVLGIGDSAFRKETSSGLAIRGAIVGLCQKCDNEPGGPLHVIEFFSKRQRRVTRSTFAAELLSLSDCFDICKLVSYALAEISHPYTANQLVKLEETGTLPVPIELCVDARSVFDSLVSEQTRCSEGGLLMTLFALKESLKSHLIAVLWWIDTRDMLSDSLTKGVCSRRAIMLAFSTGEWKVEHPCLSFSEPTTTHIPSNALEINDAAD